MNNLTNQIIERQDSSCLFLVDPNGISPGFQVDVLKIGIKSAFFIAE
jgi:hypothetical protein